MTKSDLTELRKLYKEKNCEVDRVTVCMVRAGEHGEPNILEDVATEYFDVHEDKEKNQKLLELFAQTIKGSMGKNLVSLPMNDASMQEQLLKLKKDGLKNEALIRAFASMVVSKYESLEHYVILIAHQAYDIPVKKSEGGNDDNSEFVYEHILCSICPIRPEKPGLEYDKEESYVKPLERHMIVDAPVFGFVYPSFDNRMEDIDNILFCMGKSDSLPAGFVETIAGSKAPLSVKEQKKVISNVVSEIEKDEQLQEEVTKAITEKIAEKANDPEEETPALNKEEIRRILEDSGVPEEGLQVFDDQMEELEENDIVFEPAVVLETKQLKPEKADIKVQIKNQKPDSVYKTFINNKECLVIELDLDSSIEVNGQRKFE